MSAVLRYSSPLLRSGAPPGVAAVTVRRGGAVAASGIVGAAALDRVRRELLARRLPDARPNPWVEILDQRTGFAYFGGRLRPGDLEWALAQLGLAPHARPFPGTAVDPRFPAPNVRAISQRAISQRPYSLRGAPLRSLGAPNVDIVPGHRYELQLVTTEPCASVDASNIIAALSLGGWEQILVEPIPFGSGCTVKVTARWPSAFQPTTIDLGFQLPAKLTVARLTDTTTGEVLFPSFACAPPAGGCPDTADGKKQSWDTKQCQCVPALFGEPANPCPFRGQVRVNNQCVCPENMKLVDSENTKVCALDCPAGSKPSADRTRCESISTAERTESKGGFPTGLVVAGVVVVGLLVGAAVVG